MPRHGTFGYIIVRTDGSWFVPANDLSVHQKTTLRLVPRVSATAQFSSTAQTSEKNSITSVILYGVRCPYNARTKEYATDAEIHAHVNGSYTVGETSGNCYAIYLMDWLQCGTLTLDNPLSRMRALRELVSDLYPTFPVFISTVSTKSSEVTTEKVIDSVFMMPFVQASQRSVFDSSVTTHMLGVEWSSTHVLLFDPNVPQFTVVPANCLPDISST